MFDISGKVGLVTGGASGIGFESAKQLLENGVRGVAIADINVESGKIAEEKLGHLFGKEKVIFIQTDVANMKSFEDAFERTLHKFKNIDILVNNAGIVEDGNHEKLINVNFIGITNGIVLAMENFISKHRTDSEGVIINTASIAGTQTHACYPIYGATKSAVVSLTMALGNKVHYERTKIKVVAVAPGYTETNIDNNIAYFNEFCKTLAERQMNMFPPQSTEFLVNNMMRIIKKKPSGTVWIVEDNQEAYEYINSIPAIEYDY